MSDNEFPNKWAKKLPEGFMESAENMSNDELKQALLKAEGIVSDTEKDMENDSKLNTLKEDVKMLAGAYKDTISSEKAKSKFCLYVLRSRGVQ